MKQENRQLCERTENEVRNLLAEILKIDTACLNKKDQELLSFHVDQILKDTREVSYESKVSAYARREHKELDEGFQKQQAAYYIKSELHSIGDRKNIDPKMNDALKNLIKFNDQEMVKPSEKARSNYLKEAWQRLYIANQILSDYSDVCTYLKEHAERPEAIRSLARRFKKDKYRIDRKYYSMDAIVSNGKVELKNFMIHRDRINDRVNDKELSIQ